MSNNECGPGYCSKGYNSARVAECQAGLGGDWNGLCAFQDGNRVDDESDEVRLTCCNEGCTMSKIQYAQWNGLCAYQS